MINFNINRIGFDTFTIEDNNGKELLTTDSTGISHMHDIMCFNLKKKCVEDLENEIEEKDNYILELEEETSELEDRIINLENKQKALRGFLIGLKKLNQEHSNTISLDSVITNINQIIDLEN